MILRNDNYGSSEKDYIFFRDHYHQFKPLKKITVYFNDENFLFTKYKASPGTTLIAENWKGDEIHLTGANCGYGGTGPHKTAQILMLAGLDSSTAENIVQAPTLEIQFDSQGNIQTTNTFHNLFFSSQPEYQNRCAVFLDEYTFLQSEAKKLYFVNPQIHNIQGLFNAIDKFQPYEFQYDLRDNSPLDSGYLHQQARNCRVNSEWSYINGANVILKSEHLDIICFLDSRLRISVINVLYYYLFHSVLFDDFIQMPNSKIRAYLIRLLSKPQYTNHSGIYKITRRK